MSPPTRCVNPFDVSLSDGAAYARDMTSLAETAPDAWLLLILFGGAFLDALPGPCLFILGEPFFLMAGHLLHETGSVWPAISVLVGALLADQTGFWIGQRAATPLKRLVLARSGRRRAYRRARQGLQSRLILFVAVSRLLGPVAWITPTLAGSLDVSWLRFSLGSVLGVVIGVGQFILYGWLLAAGVALAGGDLGHWVQAHALYLLIGANLLGLAGIWLWRHVSASGRVTRSGRPFR